MSRHKTNLSQEAFDFFPQTEVWPEGYKESLYHLSIPYNRLYGLDIETEGLTPYDRRVRVISFAVSPKEKEAYASYTLFNTIEGIWYDIERLKLILENPNIILSGHNIKYDANWIAVKFGIQIKCMLFDTMFAQYLIDENVESNSLGALTEIYPDLKGYKDDINREDLKREAKDKILIYNCKDADGSRRLYDYFVPKLKAGGYDKLMATSSMILPVLSKMETKGVYLDKEFAYKTQTKLFSELVNSRYKMSEIIGTSFDPDSYKSLGRALYKTLEFTPTKFTTNGSPATDGEAIGYLVDQTVSEKQSKFITEILRYKKQMKLLTTYYQPIERWTRYDGRVHANYSLGRFDNEEGSGGTVTGRLSCREPNLQNIPRGKEHRGMFRATDGYIMLDGDFNGLEMRVAAFLSQEPVMIEAFLNNLDIHTAVMSDLQNIPYDVLQSILKDSGSKEYEKTKTDRVAIKRVNFGILYGVQARRLQRLLRIELGMDMELDYCKTLISNWLGRYRRVAEWIQTQKIQAVAYKFVSMPLGQKRRLPEASFDKTKEAAHALSQATNFPVQSFASWICLIGARLLDDYFQSINVDGQILMLVHDSVTSEVSIEKSNVIGIDNIKVDVKRIMEVETLNYIRDVFGVDFNVPLVFDIKTCERWE